jgi:hypothetical protein
MDIHYLYESQYFVIVPNYGPRLATSDYALADDPFPGMPVCQFSKFGVNGKRHRI